MADDDNSAATLPPMPPGYSSVMRGGPDPSSPPATGQWQPWGPPGDLSDHPESVDDTRRGVQVVPDVRFTPAQLSQISTYHNAINRIQDQLGTGSVRPEDGNPEIERYRQMISGMQPAEIPRVGPPPMAQIYAEHVHYDKAGNMFLRQPNDGSIDVRPPSASSPQSKHLDAMHEAAMAHADTQVSQRTQAREHLHDAMLNPPADDPGHLQLINEEERKQGAAKTQGMLDKNNAAAEKQNAAYQKEQVDRARKEADAAEARSKGYLSEAQKELEAKKDDNPNSPTYGAKIPYKPEDVIKLAHQKADLFEQFHAERKAKQTPTLSPPPSAEPATPTRLAPPAFQHPNVRPEAPPEVHQARQQLDDWCSNTAAILQNGRLRSWTRPARSSNKFCRGENEPVGTCESGKV